MTDSTSQERFLQIGEAAERAQLTQRTLRYYEEKGLLAPPTRMEGGFRLYSPEDMERIERIRQLKELLGFSLAEIKEMLDAEDVRLQIRAGWRADADAAEKAEKLRRAREVTLHQIQLIDQKMAKMASMRDELAERIRKYDEWLLKHSEAAANADAPQSEGTAAASS
ncbi:MAG: MerR family transcriptional regulator [Tepidiforma sp.]